MTSLSGLNLEECDWVTQSYFSARLPRNPIKSKTLHLRHPSQGCSASVFKNFAQDATILNNVTIAESPIWMRSPLQSRHFELRHYRRVSILKYVTIAESAFWITSISQSRHFEWRHFRRLPILNDVTIAELPFWMTSLLQCRYFEWRHWRRVGILNDVTSAESPFWMTSWQGGGYGKCVLTSVLGPAKSFCTWWGGQKARQKKNKEGEKTSSVARSFCGLDLDPRLEGEWEKWGWT